MFDLFLAVASQSRLGEPEWPVFRGAHFSLGQPVSFTLYQLCTDLDWPINGRGVIPTKADEKSFGAPYPGINQVLLPGGVSQEADKAITGGVRQAITIDIQDQSSREPPLLLRRSARYGQSRK